MTDKDLRSIATGLLDPRGVVVLATESDGKAVLTAAAGADTGIRARDLLTHAAREVGGGAGGKGPIAHAGGRRPENLPRAIAEAAKQARELLK
jgi:alanyl-tRNA synthetase